MIQEICSLFSSKIITNSFEFNAYEIELLKRGIPISQIPKGSIALITSDNNKCFFDGSSTIVTLVIGTVIEKLYNDKFKILATYYYENNSQIPKYYEGGVRESQYLSLRGVPLNEIDFSKLSLYDNELRFQKQ